MLVLAQVSDLHLDAGERSRDRAKQVMAYLNTLARPVDAVLVTGDVADHGAPEEYRAARDLLASHLPVFVLPGNHDRREEFRRGLLDEPGGAEPVNRVQHAAGATFVMCDSTIPGRADGYLADETLAWADAVLAGAPDGPAFVCMHHPPVTLGSPFVDAIRQRGGERLADLVRRHPRVVAVLCGHAHTAGSTTFAGRPLVVAPGVVSTLTFPWEHGDDLDYAQPPAIAFHVYDGERLTTHFRVVPWPGPRRG